MAMILRPGFAAIDVGSIDPASSTPLGIAFARTLDDLLIPEHQNTDLPVIVLLTDTVPNVDMLGNGREWRHAGRWLVQRIVTRRGHEARRH